MFVGWLFLLFLYNVLEEMWECELLCQRIKEWGPLKLIAVIFCLIFSQKTRSLGTSGQCMGVTVSHSMKSLRNAIITSPICRFSKMKCEQLTENIRREGRCVLV